METALHAIECRVALEQASAALVRGLMRARVCMDSMMLMPVKGAIALAKARHHSVPPPFMLALCLPIIGLVVPPGSPAKQTLLTAVADLRRDATVARRDAVLDAVASLEACRSASDPLSPIDGRWTLIFSTQVSPPSSRANAGNAFQPLIDAAYSTFFKFAPALAGAQPDGSSSEAANEQLVDLASGEVRNRVRIALPFGGPRLEILVNGDARLTRADDLEVTFNDCTFTFDDGSGDEGLRLPLPRPVGSLQTTWCDADLRVSRGGRGGIFVLRRLRTDRRL